MGQEEVIQATEQEMWAIVELMDHGRTAGRISRPSDFGGMLRVDVPTEDGEYRTEFYGMPAIYSVKLVSEEIAQAYVEPVHDLMRAQYTTCRCITAGLKGKSASCNTG